MTVKPNAKPRIAMRSKRVLDVATVTALILACHGAVASSEEGSADTCKRGEDGKCIEVNDMFTDSWSICEKAFYEDYLCHSVCSLQRSLRFKRQTGRITGRVGVALFLNSR